MITIEERLEFSLSPNALFAFLADFRTLPEWDPGIVRASLRSGTATEVGATYDITSRFLGRDLPLVYRTRVYDADARFAEIAGVGDGVYATDRISIAAKEGGCRLIWQADFQLRGPIKYVDALTKPIFVQLGKKAMAGLQRRVAQGGIGETAVQPRVQA
ncbi:MAG: SRPBCC family protein [Myxococcota bacterium]